MQTIMTGNIKNTIQRQPSEFVFQCAHYTTLA